MFESPFSGIFEAVKRNKGMKTTEYFRYLRKRPDRANIKEEWIFLAIIIPTGAWMSRMAAGKFGYLCGVAAVDLSIATALLTSSLVFWKMKAFSSSQVQEKE